ncbi:MAG: hypothetical protein QNJ61_14930 [Desulfobacterales bacterium]|nr:hypothetical protein [Desulfobacterales bacterium]
MGSLTSWAIQCGNALRRFLRALPAWVRRDFIWSLLLIPAAFTVLVYRLSAANFQGWANSDVFKSLMEIVHPAFLLGCLLLSLVRLLMTRDRAFAFLAVLSAFVLGREIMGQGSTIILLAGLTGLIAYADRHPDRIVTLRQAKWALNLVALCFVCYLASQLLDRGVIKRIGWLILWDTSWKPPYASNLEEALEALGGFFLLLSPLTIRGGKRR